MALQFNALILNDALKRKFCAQIFRLHALLTLGDRMMSIDMEFMFCIMKLK